MAPDDERRSGDEPPRQPPDQEPGEDQTDPWGFLRVGGDPLSADQESREGDPAAEVPDDPDQEPEVEDEPGQEPEVPEEPSEQPKAPDVPDQPEVSEHGDEQQVLPGQPITPSGEDTQEWDLETALEAGTGAEEGDSEAWEALEAEYREELTPAEEQTEVRSPEPEGEEESPAAVQADEQEPDQEPEPEQEEEAEQVPVAAEAEPEEPFEIDYEATPAAGGMPPGMFIPPGWEREFLQPDEVGDKPPRRRGLAARFAAASLVIVVSFAAATSISILNYLSDIASALGRNSGLAGVREQLVSTGGGKPQTILLLGSDERKVDRKNGYPARSDTAILLRIDPNQDAIALLSFPRDLKVKIPGHGTDKLNAAYAFGGPKLTLRTIKGLTGLTINHLVNVNFNGFLQATYAIDCIYVDVDRRYFVPPGAGYAEIDLQPGYQRLCGSDALSYVRFRHADSDLVRGARQQDFLREARSRIGPERLIDERKELIRIFTRYTTSDIDDPETMLEVMKLFLAARDSPIKEIHFKGRIGPSYVFATPAQVRSAVRQFLGVQASSGPRGELAGQGSALKPKAKEKKSNKKSKKARKRAAKSSSSGLEASSLGRQLARTERNRFSFPLYYPTRIVPGSIFAQKPRGYYIRGEKKRDHYGAMKWVFRSGLGEYYGLMETSWSAPPILSHPSETRKLRDRDYQLFYDNDRLRLVSWHDGAGTYWVSNTLLQTLTEQQMLGIATSMRKLGSS